MDSGLVTTRSQREGQRGDTRIYVRLTNIGMGGEFHKFAEFLSLVSLIPSSACATFSLFFCMPSSS